MVLTTAINCVSSCLGAGWDVQGSWASTWSFASTALVSGSELGSGCWLPWEHHGSWQLSMVPVRGDGEWSMFGFKHETSIPLAAWITAWFWNLFGWFKHQSGLTQSYKNDEQHSLYQQPSRRATVPQKVYCQVNRVNWVNRLFAESIRKSFCICHLKTAMMFHHGLTMANGWC